jgi:hypothetical protein
MPTREIELRESSDGSPWLEVVEGGISHGTWSKRLVRYFLGEGAAEAGRWKVTVEKVGPTAARIRQPHGLAWNCANCGLPWGMATARCPNCNAKPGPLMEFNDLRGKDGNPLVTEG